VANSGGAIGHTGGTLVNTGGTAASTGGTTANTGGKVGNTGGKVGNTGGQVGNTGGAASAGASNCSTSADCRLVDDYCTGCDCRALSKSEPDPKCSGTPVNCLIAPCQNHTAACRAGRCVAE
jgi:hypothetical protein